jgi:hypothetical protein
MTRVSLRDRMWVELTIGIATLALWTGWPWLIRLMVLAGRRAWRSA